MSYNTLTLEQYTLFVVYFLVVFSSFVLCDDVYYVQNFVGPTDLSITGQGTGIRENATWNIISKIVAAPNGQYLYVADRSYRIAEIYIENSEVQDVAGGWMVGYADGRGFYGLFTEVIDIVLNPLNNFLYCIDLGPVKHSIRVVNTFTTDVTSINITADFLDDSSQFTHLALDPDNNLLYIISQNNNTFTLITYDIKGQTTTFDFSSSGQVNSITASNKAVKGDSTSYIFYSILNNIYQYASVFKLTMNQPSPTIYWFENYGNINYIAQSTNGLLYPFIIYFTSYLIYFWCIDNLFTANNEQ
eukprot:TRINITY_DN7914_c0_g1_i1.p1 TRINITY_DN7914_c0_g1~~TRINITY_DN7914_c0_g1_i1.p1  ORF type:complete len:302 (-),score=54.84 TRINITY_DN7914_c0_g1_i1:56-961(-)